MYYSLGYNEIIKTILILSTPFLDSDKNIESEDLYFALKKYFSKVQPDIPKSNGNSVNFITEKNSNVVMFKKLLELEFTTFQINIKDMERNLSSVNEGYQVIIERDSNLATLFNFIVDYVLITTTVDSPGSASTPLASNLIWIQPQSTWGIYDIVESLFHELTHLILYLDEQCYGHYENPKELFNQNSWISSAIRNEKRPVNAVVHSIIVAYEILCLRESWKYSDRNLILHGLSDELLDKTIHSLECLKNNKVSWDLLNVRTKYILSKIEKKIINNKKLFKSIGLIN